MAENADDTVEKWRLTALRFQISLALLGLKVFDPDQPRWPAGRSDGGQWRPAGGAESVEASFNPLNEAKCNLQMLRDEELCRAVRSRECWSMVLERWNACMRDEYIPQLRVGL
jgi:hypothetical protein